MRKRIAALLVILISISLVFSSIPRIFGQPENIKITNYSYYINQSGLLDVVGEVQNVGQSTIDAVYLRGSVLSTTGAYLSDSAAKVWVAYIVSQQKAPFIMEFPAPTDDFWRLEDIGNVQFTVALANATSSHQYPDLRITSSRASIGNSGDYNGAYTVDGEIENTGSQTATNITVVGTFFNSTGTVVAVGYTLYLTPTNLSPSQKMSFQIYALDLNQFQVPSNLKITNYTLLVQTQLPILQGPAPSVSPYQGSGDSVTTSPSPTEIHSNNSPIPAINYAVVIVIIIVAVAGTVVALRTRKTKGAKTAGSTKVSPRKPKTHR
jgi:hypothetical protein